MTPRTQSRGYSCNPALIVVDELCDPVFGLGHDYGTEVNEPQLIAAANVCDEMVQLANGQQESRYTSHYHYDTATAPGDAISTILASMGGRISRVGGEWFIWPAYWQGPVLQLRRQCAHRGLSSGSRSAPSVIASTASPALTPHRSTPTR